MKMPRTEQDRTAVLAAATNHHPAPGHSTPNATNHPLQPPKNPSQPQPPLVLLEGSKGFDPAPSSPIDDACKIGCT